MNDGYQMSRIAGQTATRDVQPLTSILRTLLRWSWLIALAGVGVGLLVLVTSRPEATEARATTRIGLTNQVVWPFYDAARDRLEIQLTEPGFDTEIEEAIEGELVELTMVAPANQAFVELTAVAADAETASEAATLAAERLVQQSVSAQEERLTSLITDNERESADLGAEAEEISRQMDANLVEQQALRADPSAQTFTAVTRLESAYRQLELQRDAVVQEQLEVTAEAADLSRQLRSVQPEAEVLRRAEITEASAGQRPWTTAVLAGLAAAMVTGLAVIILQREFGRIRTPWHAGSIARTPVFGHITGTGHDLRGVASVADHVLDQLARGHRVLGVTGVGDPTAGATIHLLGEELPTWDLTVLSVEKPSASIDPAADGVDAIQIEDLRSIDEIEGIAEFIDDEVKQDLVLVDLDGDYDSDDTFRLRSRICSGVLIAAIQGKTRAVSLRSTASRVRRGGEVLLGVVLIEPKALRDRGESDTDGSS